MRQVLIKKGQAQVKDVPAPLCGKKEILVQVHYSCISAGTEVPWLKKTGTPLYRRVLEQPHSVRKALEMIRTQGLANAIARVTQKLDATSPVGYSAAGTVIEAGETIKDISPGDRVACAGSGIAHHAEFIAVPRNLVVKVPDTVSLESAATVALGSTALQAVRRAAPRLGEFVAVIGLGILGQLVVQMLRAQGCRVAGIDIDQRRIELARASGMERGIHPSQDDVVDEVVKFSSGYGADSVIVTASTESSETVNQAMELCRKKGKVIIVGAVGLDLKREVFYRKELDLLISTSYGPGRYDERYESEGEDYPYAYVRWTENRNMEAYLRLLQHGTVDCTPLIERVYPVEKTPEAYEELKAGKTRPLIVILEYTRESIPSRKVIIAKPRFSRDRVTVGVIGAGGFAKAVLLPNLRRLNSLYTLAAIASRSGVSARAVATHYGASYATTDFKEILEDKDIDIVVIATRHNLHAPMVIAAAQAGKAVFVEKPMALNREELVQLVQVLEKTEVPFMVGYNRRFSPYAKKIKEIIGSPHNPVMINYRMNAGFIPEDHWIHSEEGGGRNRGEACHIYDLFTFFTECEVDSVAAVALEPKTARYRKDDNFVATIKYRDGSLCSLTYTALGTEEVSKEQMEVYVDGAVIGLDDYKRMEARGNTRESLRTGRQEKGHYEELKEFAQGLKEGKGYRIPLWQLVQAAEISFEVETQIGQEFRDTQKG